MKEAVKNKIEYKINIMILSCFSAKTLFVTFVCVVACLLYINVLNIASWNKMLFSELPTQWVNGNLDWKNNIYIPNRIYQTVKEVTQCYDRPLNPSVQRRGNFWVFYNYVRAENQHRCFESVTYTTQGDYTFLDNVMPLIERWQGPISVALHAPGDDFQPTLDSIAYLRNCETDLIKQYVTFHLFFATEHIPNITTVKALTYTYQDKYNCSDGAPYLNKNYKDLYKTQANLTYPINVARNIARITAQTHFIFPSDIELYPTPNLISKFLLMVARQRELFEDKSRKIFVLPVFEIIANATIPQNKSVLQKMVNKKTAFYFHQRICSLCHGIPNATQWLNQSEITEDLNVFVTTKRHGKYSKWEAFYIGTHEEPLFDERLTWEGQSNKMIQGYTLCLLDYTYMVLDQAFLTHKPGIKPQSIQKLKFVSAIRQTKYLLRNFLRQEMSIVYGENTACVLK